MSRPQAPTWAEIEAGMSAAIAAGRHCRIEDWHGEVCAGCDQWTRVIYHTAEDGKRFCPACADKMGQGPQAWIEKQRRRAAMAAMAAAARGGAR